MAQNYPANPVVKTEKEQYPLCDKGKTLFLE
jgi:hypothetical protein